MMLLIFSRHSNSSEQVPREVQLAVDCRVPIIRLRLEDIHKGIPRIVSMKQKTLRKDKGTMQKR